MNVRTKTCSLNSSTYEMIKKIYQQEGIVGFTKGFSANYYSAIICGFLYYGSYKALKTILKERFGDHVSLDTIYFTAGFLA